MTGFQTCALPIWGEGRQQFGRIGVVERDRAGHPEIGEDEPVKVVEKHGEGHAGKAGDGQCAGG